MNPVEEKRLKQFSDDMVEVAIRKLNIDFAREKFTKEQFAKGVKTEYKEHAKTVDGEITMAARIARDHLDEMGGTYYDFLDKMEEEMKKEQKKVDESMVAGDAAGLPTNLGTIHRTYPAPLIMGKIRNRWGNKKKGPSKESMRAVESLKTFKEFVNESNLGD